MPSLKATPFRPTLEFRSALDDVVALVEAEPFVPLDELFMLADVLKPFRFPFADTLLFVPRLPERLAFSAFRLSEALPLLELAVKPLPLSVALRPELLLAPNPLRLSDAVPLLELVVNPLRLSVVLLPEPLLVVSPLRLSVVLPPLR